MNITDLPLKTRERLRYIEFRVLFLGEVCRPDIARRFGVKDATCSRDLSLYQELAPENICYALRRRRYVCTQQMSPLFEHDPLDALRFLHSSQFTVTIEDPTHLKVASYPVPRRPLQWKRIFPVTQALQASARGKKEAVNVVYVSDSGGEKSRAIIPHAVFTFSGFWYLRALDGDSGEFRNFKFNRILKSWPDEASVPRSDIERRDHEWENEVVLTLVAHPNKEHKQAIEEDYGIPPEGKTFKVPEALLGFLLNEWRVDCSLDASLNKDEYPLRLLELDNYSDIESFMKMAPGAK